VIEEPRLLELLLDAYSEERQRYRAQLAALFQECDGDGDGELDKDDFVRLARRAVPSWTAGQAKDVFWRTTVRFGKEVMCLDDLITLSDRFTLFNQHIELPRVTSEDEVLSPADLEIVQSHVVRRQACTNAALKCRGGAFWIVADYVCGCRRITRLSSIKALSISCQRGGLGSSRVRLLPILALVASFIQTRRAQSGILLLERDHIHSGDTTLAALVGQSLRLAQVLLTHQNVHCGRKPRWMRHRFHRAGVASRCHRRMETCGRKVALAKTWVRTWPWNQMLLLGANMCEWMELHRSAA
jgi:hypothetical protein